MKLHHIGIIVKDINKSIGLYKKLGYRQVGETVIDNIQKNIVAFMQLSQAPLIELIEPVDGSSSVINFKCGYHHLCFEEDVNENVRESFGKLKIGKIFTQPILAPALDFREIVFAYLYNEMLIEIILMENVNQ